MSKYDVPMDTGENSSTGKIIRMMEPSSYVLEFGCAEGRMTQYMKENMNCKVYIVEIDKEAFQKAKKYAEGGICCDANTLEWKNAFDGIFFDYILFADVLEHLQNPELVLNCAVSLLKYNGMIIASIPNIGHGDVICSLLCNRFHYTSVGLLDNTHIHFWGKTDFYEMAERMGLCVVKEDAVLEKVNSTEQAVYGRRLPDTMRKQIAQFPYSSVYQFIFAMQKKRWVEENYIERVSNIKFDGHITFDRTAKIYFDMGDGYSEEKSKSYSFQSNELFSELFSERISVPKGCNRIRFDPIEGYYCVLRNLEVRSSEGMLNTQVINGVQMNDLYLFQTTDPQVEIALPHSINGIEITAEIMTLSGAMGLSLLNSASDARREQMHTELERSNLADRLTETEAERDSLTERLTGVEAEREDLRGSLAHAEAERDNLRGSLAHAEAERDDLRDQLQKKTAQAEELNAQLLNISNSFEIISNSTCWKITKPVRVVLDWGKTIRILNLSIKGLKSLKANGVAFTWSKIKRWRDSNKNIALYESDYQANQDYSLYTSDYQANQDYSLYTTDIKILAFYLPQYHTFPENDAWWGKGFTEWTNVKKSVPRFKGHYQPRVPHVDIGYYCLEDIEVMRKQAALAKQHGIYGFCFYYYWFSGKRLMEKPVDQLLEHPEIDIPFCLCWANENWTRRWDGQDQDVLIKQNYTDEDDEQFIVDIKKYLDDPRYIRIDDAPVIIIYNPTAMPDCRKSFAKWRETARRIGVGEIKIWICLTWGRDAEMLRISDLVDAEVEFPPHNIGGDWMELKDIEHEGEDCIIYDYYRGVEYIIGTWERNGNTLLPRHYTCMLAWDNSARRRDGWHAFYHFSLKEFYRWLTEAVRQSRARLRPEERFIFVNAWNEWGEGTYLEPEEKYGYANINTVSKALFDLPLDWNTTVINEQYPIAKDERVCKANPPRIAVQIHVFFVDLVDELIEQLNSIPYPFDLYITTDTGSKKEAILSAFEERCRCTRVEVLVLDNRGRDVAPLLVQLAPVIGQYDYFGHFHTKKTVTADYGDGWRDYLFSNLLGCEGYVKRVFGLFEGQKELGIVFPELYPPIREHAKWNGENEGIRALLARMNCSVELPEQLAFPAGNMFWARTEAVKPLFELGLTQADFPEECGQRYATIAHQIERSWVYIAQAKGYSAAYVMNGCLNK